ncbi:thiol reductant ABC exporter subunit CydD [Acetobacter cerevisiae]|uniref:ABC transporter ATP-binding protein n=1 Tax=Acetobacter cerevisiae TaxID=178900 RepID=A0A149Q5J4_9PROT|nr:thiol reductant ABC exporter subunit CydD [Acetobacter cerevisiae]KXU92589.1 ABC transporter ATP-binding protein [Acetobacter cerevisiae]GBQ04968.1 ABC transporter ATP-binding protein [Acetobacter cerevisiae DSM 14362]
MHSKQPKNDWQTAGMARRAKGWLAGSVTLGGMAAVLFVLHLTLLAGVIDDLTFKGKPFAAEQHTILLLLACLGGSLFLQWLADMAGTEAGLRIAAHVRRDALRHLFRAGPVGCTTLPAGRILTTLTEGVDALEPYFAQYIPRAAMMVVLPLLILAMVLHLDGWSFVILACTGPLIPVFMALVGYSAQSIMDRQWMQLVVLGSSFLDSLRGLSTLRLLGQTEASISRMAAATDAHRASTLSVMKIAFLTSAVLEFFSSLSIALVAVVFGARLLSGTVDFRSAFLVLLLAPEYFMPLRAFSASYHARQNATAAAARLADLFTLPEMTQPENQPRLTHTRNHPIAHLMCSDLTAGYPGQAPAFQALSCTLSRGSLTVITGESGAGKTTFLRLVLGFLQPSSGQITAYDTTGAPLEVWQSRTAWVPQRPVMTMGSIADTLRLAKPNATDAELHAAAQQADALEFIEALPQGFATSVGERGACLSGGQIKRLALARALLRNPDILCLDEPTSDLDPASALRVAHAIRRCSANRIVLVATHHADMVALADQCLHISDGHGEPFSAPQRACA